jgi:hypothetical protein
MEPWRRRTVLGIGIFLTLFSIAFVAALTWAILYIHQERSGMRHVAAKIVSVNASKRSSFGRSVKFGSYNVTVRYRSDDGVEKTNSLDLKTYGFPSAGDSITLLFNQYGTVESNPFPELWIILGLVYSGFGSLIWFVVKQFLLR